MLSDVTDYAAVVIAPAHEVATIRSVQIVSLGTHVRDGRVSLNALLVVVLSDGSVGKHTLELDDSTSDEVLREAATRLAGVLVGRPLGQVEPSSPGRQEPGDRRSDDPISALVRAATRALRPERASRADEGEVFVEGRARMATVFDTVETIRSVLAVLEKHYVVVSLLREALDRGGPQDSDQQVRVGTSIGAEHGSDVVFEPLHACSVIVAPYLVDGRLAGSVGVLGPTRMNYPQAMAAVAEVSARLSQRLSDG